MPEEHAADGFENDDAARADAARADSSAAIRGFGCGLETVPLIFTHVGKTGGRTIRKNIALGGNKRKNSFSWKKDSSFYPLASGEHAEFCSSCEPSFCARGRGSCGDGMAHSGMRSCNARGRVDPPHADSVRVESDAPSRGERRDPSQASTPLGQAIACANARPDGPCAASGSRCLRVYTGHNYLGTELHWLPPKMLASWWRAWAPEWAPARPRARAELGRLIDELGEGRCRAVGMKGDEGMNADRLFASRDEYQLRPYHEWTAGFRDAAGAGGLPKKPAAEKPAAKKPAGGARKRRPLPYDAQGKPAAKKPAAKKPGEEARGQEARGQEARGQEPAAKKPEAKKPAANAGNLIAKISELNDLLTAGAITQSEFDTLKRNLLSSPR
ncbi:hypothetical protein JL720_9729 [Aureococcus anophagefferens]|nr:hypothetical protein JL720_9729 [Aureococcus anophagefferens]